MRCYDEAKAIYSNSVKKGQIVNLVMSNKFSKRQKEWLRKRNSLNKYEHSKGDMYDL